MDIRIFPPEDFLEARLCLPLSKSMSARAAIIAALTPGASCPEPMAECDDTAALLAALRSNASEINVGASGTAMRFLTAYYAVQPGAAVKLDGSERMRCRPIGPLVDALRTLGADIEYAGEAGYPPLLIHGKSLPGGKLSIDATISSQYISALLMVAPLMEQGLELALTGDPVSLPYIRMTLAMMTECGADCGFTGPDCIAVSPKPYSKAVGAIEADWSAAAPWYEIESLSAGVVTIDNLATEGSVQGDSVLAHIFRRLGVDTTPCGDEGVPELTANPDPDARISLDCTKCPDLAQCIAVTCSMLGTPFRLTGLQTLSIKETDRIEALRSELQKIGTCISIPAPGVMEWNGGRAPVTELPVFDTHGDHRMALCLAPVAIYLPGIVIKDADVVSKSYPAFWDDLRNAGFVIEPYEAEEAPQ